MLLCQVTRSVLGTTSDRNVSSSSWLAKVMLLLLILSALFADAESSYDRNDDDAAQVKLLLVAIALQEVSSMLFLGH